MRKTLVSILVMGTVVFGVLPSLVSTPVVEAQGVTPELLASYLTRSGVTWRRDDKDRNVLRVSKTSGLKRASKVELVITNIPDKSLVTVRAFSLSEGKYLGLSRVTNQAGLMREMLNRNATAFGAYFVDNEGDIGFRFIFTTESGLGYTAFKAVLDELLRIADEFIVGLYQKYQ